MGFFFDSLRSMFGGTEEGRLKARAGMAGRLWNIEGHVVSHQNVPDELGMQIWHFPKGGKHPAFAVTMTIGTVSEQPREWFVCTLADSDEEKADIWAWILAHVATRDPRPQVGDVVALPEGVLGRSSHRHVLLTPALSLSTRELPDYESVLEAKLVQLVTVTDREAAWIADHSAEEFLEAMLEQRVAPLADRRAGDTRL